MHQLKPAARAELRDLQRRLKATMIFVTHDQEEAMSLADEIFLFRSGLLLQSGPGDGLYRRPKSRYVAEFFGKANLFRAVVQRGSNGGDVLRPTASESCIVRGPLVARADPSRDHLCMVRPEAWRLGPPGGDGVPGRVEEVMLLGDRLELRVDTAMGRQCVVTLGYEPIAIGDRVTLTTAAEHVHFLPSEELGGSDDRDHR